MTYNLASFMDLTSLNEEDTDETIADLCQKASVAHVAAVCVYPKFIKLAKTLTSIKIATVANFPHGLAPLDTVIETIRDAIQNGAAEIDVVFPYRTYLRGEKTSALEFIRVCKNTMQNKALLKVILETGAISDHSMLADISKAVIQAGADFLKTSTGKISVGATVNAAEILLTAIKDQNPSVGFKASGGIRNQEQAMQYVHLAEKIFSPAWVTKDHFRLGISRLFY